MNQPSARKTIAILPEILVGGGMGLLVGLLIGLAVSEVVGGVIAGLTALLAAFLGLDSRKSTLSDTQTCSDEQRRWRLAAFGVVCALGLLLGLSIRTFNLLAPDLETQHQQWQQLGFNGKEARNLVAYQMLGIAPEDWQTVNSQRVTARNASVLFSQNSNADIAEICGTLSYERYSDPVEWLNAWTLSSGSWPQVAQVIDEIKFSLSSAQQEALLLSIWKMACQEAPK